MNHFKTRNNVRNWIARLLLNAANRIATETTICSTDGKWKFLRKWESVPYRPEPHKWAKQGS
jgi:hypothetical protein